jgi:hypothetical protein
MPIDSNRTYSNLERNKNRNLVTVTHTKSAHICKKMLPPVHYTGYQTGHMCCPDVPHELFGNIAACNTKKRRVSLKIMG